MNEVLTIGEIEARFKAEWVLVEDPQTNEGLEVQGGKVRWHSQDRDEVYRKAVELRPRRFAVLYTGQMPEGTAIVLCEFGWWQKGTFPVRFPTHLKFLTCGRRWNLLTSKALAAFPTVE
jgi:hypothetical protein